MQDLPESLSLTTCEAKAAAAADLCSTGSRVNVQGANIGPGGLPEAANGLCAGTLSTPAVGGYIPVGPKKALPANILAGLWYSTPSPELSLFSPRRFEILNGSVLGDVCVTSGVEHRDRDSLSLRDSRESVSNTLISSWSSSVSS